MSRSNNDYKNKLIERLSKAEELYEFYEGLYRHGSPMTRDICCHMRDYIAGYKMSLLETLDDEIVPYVYSLECRRSINEIIDACRDAANDEKISDKEGA